MKHMEKEYQIKMVTRNYLGDVVESFLMAKAYSENVANLIKATFENQEMYKDSITSFEIVEMPRR